MVTCLCCSPSPGPLLLSTAPGKSMNPPTVDCNHTCSDSLVPLGWRCGFCQQAALQCQTTDSTHTWLTAAGSRFPFCHEKEKTLECPPFAGFHGPGPVVLNQGTVLPVPPPRPPGGHWACLETSVVVTTLRRDSGGQGCSSAPHRARYRPLPRRERAGLERPKCRGRETLPQRAKIPLSTASKPRSKRL